MYEGPRITLNCSYSHLVIPGPGFPFLAFASWPTLRTQASNYPLQAVTRILSLPSFDIVYFYSYNGYIFCIDTRYFAYSCI